MKYLLEWILKGIITITFGTWIIGLLKLLSIIFWDKRFIDLAIKTLKYIWKNKDNADR